MIEIKNLYKSFGSQKVLDGISFKIEGGSTTAVIGPSGVGKSVLIKIITGLLTPDSGDVIVNGQSITQCSSSERDRLAKKMGILFQGAALFDSISLLENVSFPLYYREGFARSEALRKAFQALSDVGLASYSDKLPGEVSLGIKKRVGIARALVTEPEILLFDEPNTGLDPLAGQEIYELIKSVQARSKFTGVVISHEIPEVFQVCKKVVMLYNAKIEFEGLADDFLQSGSAVVRQFLKGDIVGPIQVG